MEKNGKRTAQATGYVTRGLRLQCSSHLFQAQEEFSAKVEEYVRSDGISAVIANRIKVPFVLAERQYDEESSSVLSHGRAEPAESSAGGSVVWEAPLSSVY